MFHPRIFTKVFRSPMFNSSQASFVTVSPFNPSGLPPSSYLETGLWQRLAVWFKRFSMDFDPLGEFGVEDERRLRRWFHTSLPQALQMAQSTLGVEVR